MNIERDVPLAPMTTLGVGGPADYLVHAQTTDDLLEAVRWAADRKVPLLILGGGSNVVIADEGFRGLVAKIDIRGVTLQDENEYATVYAAAGELWDDFVASAVGRRWSGIECLSGIPGLVGATPIQNVGAYGQEVSETIVRVEVVDRHEAIVKTLTNDECRFGYRTSLFKTEEGKRYIVTGVTYRFRIGGIATIRYPELGDHLASTGVSPSDLAAVREAVIAIRRRKGMVLDPTDPDTRSDGSFFMNPIVDARKAQELTAANPRMPAFPADGGGVKLSAAWLIEHAGFQRGFRHGNAGISTKHTLAIVNRGGSTAREVRELAGMIQARVRDAFGVELQPEPVFVGG